MGPASSRDDVSAADTVATSPSVNSATSVPPAVAPPLPISAPPLPLEDQEKLLAIRKLLRDFLGRDPSPEDIDRFSKGMRNTGSVVSNAEVHGSSRATEGGSDSSNSVLGGRSRNDLDAT